jgi:hypothetical protein
MIPFPFIWTVDNRKSAHPQWCPPNSTVTVRLYGLSLSLSLSTKIVQQSTIILRSTPWRFGDRPGRSPNRFERNEGQLLVGASYEPGGDARPSPAASSERAGDVRPCVMRGNLGPYISEPLSGRAFCARHRPRRVPAAHGPVESVGVRWREPPIRLVVLAPRSTETSRITDVWRM